MDSIKSIHKPIGRIFLPRAFAQSAMSLPQATANTVKQSDA